MVEVENNTCFSSPLKIVVRVFLVVLSHESIRRHLQQEGQKRIKLNILRNKPIQFLPES